MRLFLLTAVVILFAGCGAQGLEFEGEAGVVVLGMEPWPPRGRVETTFNVNWRGAGEAEGPEGLVLVLSMPTMDHGNTVVNLEEVGRGRFRGSGRFDHGGPWLAEVKDDDGRVLARFELDVAP